jgi:hypothetical protein
MYAPSSAMAEAGGSSSFLGLPEGWPGRESLIAAPRAFRPKPGFRSREEN